MHWTQYWANIATILGSLSVIAALVVWGKGQWRSWQRRKHAKSRRNWDGFIDLSGVGSWYVQLAEEPTEATAKVVLEVVDSKGEPFENGAYAMRNIIRDNGQLSQSPTPEQRDFLKHLRNERRYPTSINVR